MRIPGYHWTVAQDTLNPISHKQLRRFLIGLLKMKNLRRVAWLRGLKPRRANASPEEYGEILSFGFRKKLGGGGLAFADKGGDNRGGKLLFDVSQGELSAGASRADCGKITNSTRQGGR